MTRPLFVSEIRVCGTGGDNQVVVRQFAVAQDDLLCDGIGVEAQGLEMRRRDRLDPHRLPDAGRRRVPDPPRVGDLLASPGGELCIYKYVGFEEARWVLPEVKSGLENAPVAVGQPTHSPAAEVR